MEETHLRKNKYNLFIGGEWVDSESGETFETINPSNRKKLADVARAKKADVDKAVESARRGFREWKDTSYEERGRILSRVARLLRERKDELAIVETLDTGKPLSQSIAEVETAARYFEYYSGVADKIHGENIPLSGSHVNYTVREPFGVSAHIIPWNFPVGIFGRDVAPALTAGNTVVVKPSEEAPLSVLEIGEILVDAGLPLGAVNIVPGFGFEAGAILAGNRDVDIVTFTGSVETGREVMKLAANNITPVILELGGKNPLIVFPDADIEIAVENVIKGSFMHSGQVCSACSKLLLHNAIHDEFVRLLSKKVKELRIGPGIEDPDIGPVISEKQFKRVMDYIALGISEGAALLTGGKAPADPKLADGFYIEPTIFDNVASSMRIAMEEIFGPVLSIIRFEKEEEALKIANDTPYGLVAGVFTNDLNKAHNFAKELNVGQVFINEWLCGGVETPFGGCKESGFGRLKGLEALRYYTQVKNVCIKFK